MSESLAHARSRSPGKKPVHGLIALVVGVVWFGTLGFVLVHGHGDPSSVDVYSELPPGFTVQLQAQGVRYVGLSPVDAATEDQVLSQATIDAPAAATGSHPIVLRTALSTSGHGATITDQAAIMVVEPQASTATSGTSVYVAFVDPTTYQVLTTVTYDASSASGASG